MTRPPVAALLSGLLLASSLAWVGDAMPAPGPTAELRRLLDAGDTERAVEAAEKAVALLPKDAQAWLWAGRAYGRMAMEASIFTKAKWAGRTRDAWERAVALDPRGMDAQLDLLSFYRMAPSIMGGGEDKATAQVATIAALDASMGKYAAASLQLPDDPAAAEGLLREAIALDADNHRARMLLGGLALERKDWAAARAAWEPALESEALAPVARYQLGKVAAVSGEQLEQGLAHLDAYIAGPQDPELGIPAAQWRRGQVLERLGRRDEAIAAWRSAVDDKDVGALAKADLERLGH